MEIKKLKNNDYERVMEFNKLVHGEETLTTLENVIFNNPFHKGENFAYLEDKEKIIAFTGLIIHKQRFGDNEMKVGEIAVVGTHPDYRKRGYASKLMNYWIEYMKKNEIHMSFLFGIPDFYQQFNYEYAVPAHFYDYVSIELSMLDKIDGEYSIQQIKEYEIRAISEIYNICCQNNCCTEIRSMDYWKYRVKATSIDNHKWYVIKKKDKVMGYFWISDYEKNLTVREVGVLNDEASASLCEFLYDFYKDKDDVKSIAIKAPFNNRFIKYLYKRGAKISCYNEIFKGTWAGMYRIINLKETLNNLRHILNKRLEQSKFYNHTGNYSIKSEIGDVSLKIKEGKIEICEYEACDREIHIPYNILTQIVTGYKGIKNHELIRQNKDFYNNITDVVDLLGVLFPEGNPYIWDLEMSDKLE